MKRIWLTYTLGVITGAATGFCSPLWYLGFVPISIGLLWASYDLVEVPSAESSTKPK